MNLKNILNNAKIFEIYLLKTFSSQLFNIAVND